MPTLAKIAQKCATDGDPRRGLAMYQRLHLANPDDPGVWHGIGMCYFLDRQFSRARFWLAKSAAIGGHTAWHTNYGNVLEVMGEDEPAEHEYRKSLAIKPDNYPALMGLSKVLMKLGRGDEAFRCGIAAARLDPNSEDAFDNAANGLIATGDVGRSFDVLHEGLAALPKSRRLRVTRAAAHVYAGSDPLVCRAAAEAIWETRPRPMARLNNGRVGILSPDLRWHSVGYFARAMLGSGRPWIKVYHTSDHRDDHTEWFKERADEWSDVAGLSDDDLTELIRRDKIDVLIELSGLSGGQRLGVFERRAAPAQVTYLGWPGTTGIADYRIVDAVTDPVGSEGHCTERLIRVPGCFVSYTPPELPPIKRPTDGVVFGSFNAAAKLDDRTLRLWARVVESVPGSRLLLKARAFESMECQGRVRSALGLGFAAELVPNTKDRESHLATYNRVSVALDPLGYNGTTTTCEAMAMGVPVVTMRGDRHANRVGESLGAIVAENEDEYVRLAAEAVGTRAELRDDPGWCGRFWAAMEVRRQQA